MADFEQALKLDGSEARALFGRGTVKLKKGDAAGGNVDIDAAKKIQANVAEAFAR